MTAKELLSQNPTLVKPEDSVESIMQLFRDNPVSGFAVVNSENTVIGAIGKDDLFTADLALHIPTYLQLLKETHIDRKSTEELPYAAAHLLSTKASDVMNQSVMFVHEDSDLETVAACLVSGKQTIVPVVTPENKYIGVITLEKVLEEVSKNVLLPAISQTNKVRPVDNEIGVVRKDLRSRFSYIARSRAHLWLSATMILFIIGFALGIIFIVDPAPITESINTNIQTLLKKLP